MQKEILLQMLEQNYKDCSYFCKNINAENMDFRLTEQTASVGFIYRHIAETTNLIAQFLGYETEIEGTTMGQEDKGNQYNLEPSRMYFEEGYNTINRLIVKTTDDEWLKEVDTTWFGKISRIKLFSILLFHNSHHCGQISSAILKGRKIAV